MILYPMLESWETYNNLEIELEVLSALELEDLTINNGVFTKSLFINSIFRKSEFTGLKAISCDLSGASWDSSRLYKAVVEDSKLIGFSNSYGFFKDVLFKDCKMNTINFRFSKFKSVTFENCTLLESDFQNSDLEDITFINCDLRGSQLSGCNLNGADLSTSNIDGVQLNPEDLRGLRVNQEQAIYLSSLLGLKVVS